MLDAVEYEPARPPKSLADQNDLFRRRVTGDPIAAATPGAEALLGKMVITRGVHLLPITTLVAVIQQLREFAAFDHDNDPHREHDFGVIEVGDHRCFWKIDYYDRELEYGSDTPADPSSTTRILTLMLASEH
jgi:hypothetical protein